LRGGVAKPYNKPIISGFFRKNHFITNHILTYTYPLFKQKTLDTYKIKLYYDFNKSCDKGH
jgi:hypothetical protein